MSHPERLSQAALQAAIQKGTALFKECDTWIETHMPASFFEQMEPENLLLVVHHLMELSLSDFFSHIHLKDMALTLSLDGPDAALSLSCSTLYAFLENKLTNSLVRVCASI